jgi:hypothetical protein
MDMIMDSNGEFYTKEQCEYKTGMSFTLLKYNKLKRLAQTAVQLYTKNTTLEKKCDTVQNFLMRIKRGSKRVRAILCKGEIGIVSANITKYAELTETVINSDWSRILNSSWSFSYLQNSTKVFCFKLYSNLLGLNSRVAHFVRGHSNCCTFCDISNEPEENVESTKHLFFDCTHTENVLLEFYSWVFSTVRPVSRTEFFVGFDTGNDKKNKTLNVVNILVKKFIWDSKLRFTLPTTEHLKLSVISELKRISSINPVMRETFIQSDLFDIQF